MDSAGELFVVEQQQRVANGPNLRAAHPGSSLKSHRRRLVMNDYARKHKKRDPMIQFMGHVKNCLTVRRLLKNRMAPQVQNLYWYDMRLVDAIAWRGIFKVLLRHVFGWQQDEIAGNYDLVNLYYADPIGDGLNDSGATVWNCRGLDSHGSMNRTPLRRHWRSTPMSSSRNTRTSQAASGLTPTTPP